MDSYASWGNYPPVQRQQVRTVLWRTDPLVPPPDGSSLLPRGLGRSYGDSCLNEGGTLLDSRRLAHFMDFDASNGLLRCEAGVSLEEILAFAVPRGWFLPVSPGTRHVTLGGAVANDIHGKNHHRAGTIGCHVTRFELLRSDHGRRTCSAGENSELFEATIGGLGLTGLITWVELRLRRIASPHIAYESVRFGSLDEFFDLTRDSDREFEYTAAWIDCLAGGRSLGRGLFLRGNHAEPAHDALPSPSRPGGRKNVGVFAPEFLLNPLSIRVFNTLYYGKQRRRVARRLAYYEPFFFPLDSVENWNRLYGRRGFLQYQCVLPHDQGRSATRDLLARVAHSGQGSFLAVLKVFGDVRSPGLLSFPGPGITLALDFAHRGDRTLDLLEQLDQVVRASGGRVYPAKDARMSAQTFQAYYPRWRDLARHRDPVFSSSFWRRVTAGEAV